MICTPLRAEWLALTGRLTEPPVRTGRGPGGRLPDGTAGPVLVAGVAGALVDGIAPGDLVVASAVFVEGGDRVVSGAAPLLSGALRRAGLTVHVGEVVSTGRVADGAARARLAETGAIAVDTESAHLARDLAGAGPSVVRAIVDTPSRPLRRPGTVWRGIRALGSLRKAAPVLQAWADATAGREIRSAAPREDDIGYATTNRQRAVRAVARESDLVLVAGSANSSESRRLVEVAAAEGAEAHLVVDATEVELGWLAGRTRIGITAGTSAPPGLVDELAGCLSGLGAVRVLETRTVGEHVEFTLPQEVF